MPDLAWGGAGQLHPVSYPDDWDRVAELVADAPGEVLALPFSEYHAYSWNRGRTVIDPSPRYLAADVLSDDRLRVGTVVLEGENPRAAHVRALLRAGESVAGTGVAWVLVQHGAGAPIPSNSLDGLRRVYRGPYLDLYANPEAAARPVGHPARRWLPLAAHLLAAALLIGASWSLRRRATTW
jgi:hypothetical protein